MVPERLSALLRYPLYKIYHVDDVEAFEGLSNEDVIAFREEYDSELRHEIVEALRWVRGNPNADLSGVLPSLPCSNEAIHCFANKILCSLER